MCAQARAIQHTSNYFYTKVQADFAAKLCELTGYTDVFFGNSGAEANECAIKLARKYSFDKYGKGRHTIVTLVNSFHGRTLATLSATGQDVFHNYFFPFVEGFVNVPANDIDALRKLIAEDKTICAVMFEFVQGEGGVNPLDKAFVDEIFKLCARKRYPYSCRRGSDRRWQNRCDPHLHEIRRKARYNHTCKGNCRRRAHGCLPCR